MKNKIEIAGTICATLSVIPFKYDYNALGVSLVLIGIGLFCIAVYIKPKEIRNNEQCIAVCTDEIANTLIHCVGNAERGFIPFFQIINDTNLSVKEINSCLNWLVLNGWAGKKQGIKDDIFYLTPEGREVFKGIIKQKIE